MKAEDGGPAFPQIETTVHMEGHAGEYTTIPDVHSIGGMTLRDYFAAKAMRIQCELDWETTHLDQLDAIALSCYRIADAMLRAREVK